MKPLCLSLFALGLPAEALPPAASLLPLPRPELETLAVSTAAERRVPSVHAVQRSLRPMLRGAVPQGFAERRAASTRPAETADPGFRRWIAGFRGRALARGIRPEVFDTAFDGVQLQSRVVERDRNQAEFSRTLWDYLDGAVSDARVRNGRAALAEHRDTLERIERRYRVEAEVVAAIWGLESAYGASRGSTDIVSAMATLAYDGRRQDFFEAQLIAALQILQSGDVSPRRMTGSWAGAMGHTQFMPTSYLEHAQDFNGDGRRDIWSDDPTDALASTAAYLAHFGWTYGQPWGVEVRLPQGFDYALTGERVRRDAGFWRRAGVTLADGGQVPDHGEASILLPGGSEGVALMIFDNFRVIERYNPADAYVIGVGHLSDRITGGSAFRAGWPRGDRALTGDERRELQQRLTAAGFPTDGVDGIIGPNTTEAVRRFQRSVGATPDGYASLRLLERLR
ncbi:lytic murein transglycosylase [Roseibacterium sp. SDUM158016]|nr:lytic murein transglycosylase [Roseibacterium sp. SDUM158016]MCU4651690.1 lytic murein transglycosylase [Roseibacterium sp. SDUM158016]